MEYNYLEEMVKDIKDELFGDYLLEELGATIEDKTITLTDMSEEDLEETLYDELWTNDHVTGNGSGSYTFNTHKAEEYISHNLSLIIDAIEEFDLDRDTIVEHFGDAEYWDVTIRCSLLSQAISEALEELKKEYTFVFEE